MSACACMPLGAWLALFGGLVIIALLALVGLPASSPRPRPVALVAASGTWAVTWIGGLGSAARRSQGMTPQASGRTECWSEDHPPSTTTGGT